jgi:hypothetical protein
MSESLCIDCRGAVSEIVYSVNDREAGFCQSCAATYPDLYSRLRRLRAWIEKQLAAEVAIARAEASHA